LVVRTDRLFRQRTAALTGNREADLDIRDRTVVVVGDHDFERQGKLASRSTNLPVTRPGPERGGLMAAGRRYAEGTTA
jgi:hypothetical protein